MKISNINLSHLFNIKNNNSKKNNNINFTRTWDEHISWGVNIDTLGPNAKIFAFPDSKSVVLEVNKDKNDEKRIPLANLGGGVFCASLPLDFIKSGDRYQFEITKQDGSIEKVKDPYSKKQDDLLGASTVYDHSKFAWDDYNWYSPFSSSRVSRLASNENELLPVEALKIYEINIPTLTKKGTFESAKSQLKSIKQMGFNAIEIMPVENTYSYNWGYDGVDKFAPAAYLGGPDKLKELINEAHDVGLNVVMDMVPNHIGVDGSQLQKTGPYSGGNTPWGDAFNYEGENSRYVRDYIVNAALNWIDNYHCDGLRLDMTKFMNSDTTMQQIAAEVNYHFPEAFLIAEDGRSNISVRGDDYWHDWWQPHDQRVIQALKPDEIGLGKNEKEHSKKIDNISKGAVTLSRLGFDSEWDFHYYHTLTSVAYGEADLDALERAIVDSSKRIKYSTSHDETGNMDGTRVVAKYMVPLLKLSEKTFFGSDDEKRAQEYVKMKENEGVVISYDEAATIVKSQKVQQNSMHLAQKVQDGTVESYLHRPAEEFEEDVLSPLGLKDLYPRQILNSFEQAVKIYRSIEALKYFSPGPVMTFQGEDSLEMSKFNFFREFDSIKNEHYLYVQKGYKNGISAFINSKMGIFQPSKEGKKRSEQFKLLIKDLNRFKDENKSSTVGNIVVTNTVKHYQNPTIGLHSVDENSKNETFVVANFSQLDYPLYEIEFPVGEWEEVINTNNVKYGGSGECQNKNIVLGSSNKKQKTKIALPSQSTLIFKRVG